MYTFENVNQTLVGMSKEILSKGKSRNTRGATALEIPHPVMIEITNPTDRVCQVPGRQWNKYLPFIESLWLALGFNDLDALPGHYVGNLYNYSDNGVTWRGGYGPRLRGYTGIANDYSVGSYERVGRVAENPTLTSVDQLKYVVDIFTRDLHSRQAIIQIGDPAKDDYDVNFYGDKFSKITLDYPCSRLLQFMVVDGALNLTLYIRSNDIVFGMSGVNIFNFTWIQEYIANILGLPVGRYYHIVNNLHVYESMYDKVKAFADFDISQFSSRMSYQYNDNLGSLERFDEMVWDLYYYEYDFRNEIGSFDFFRGLQSNMFEDWAKTIYHYYNRDEYIQFHNQQFEFLFNRKFYKK